MKPDVLERLLIDSALGRLEPDVEVLLADHLASDVAATAQARDLQGLVRVATEVIRQPAPIIGLPSQIHRLVWRHRAEQVLALAASFVVGVGLTAVLIHANLRRQSVVAAAANPPAISVLRPALAENKIASLPFWSNQRAYLLASANAKEIMK